MAEEARPTPVEEVEEEVTVGDLAEQIKIRGPVDVERHRQFITISLISLLALIIVGHYLCVVILELYCKKVENLNNAYNAALPVVAGLAGSAITYYFTRGGPAQRR
jgi:hypothetical protein